MTRGDDWTYEYNINDLGLTTGHIAQLSSKAGRKKRHPIGFAAPAKRTGKHSAGRVAGSFPVVPRFDIREP